MLKYKLGVLVVLSTFFFIYIHSTDLQVPGIGAFCFHYQDCDREYINYQRYICESGKCKCYQGYIPDKNNKWCVVDIQKPCRESFDECYDPNAKCVGLNTDRIGTCECQEGFTLNKKTKMCSIVMGNNCSRTDECIEGTCTTGNFNYTQCICDEPLQSNINGTRCLPAINDDCSKFNECASENSICANGKECLCLDNFKPAERNNETHCLAMLNHTCENAIDCADIGGDCVNVTETEETSNYENLFLTDLSPINLPEKICACGEGYVTNPDESECLKVATAYNETCVHDVQCSSYSGFGSECAEGHCLCKTGFYIDVDFNRCVRSCLCTDDNEINKIKMVLKEIAPTLELLAESNNMNISRALRRIDTL